MFSLRLVFARRVGTGITGRRWQCALEGAAKWGAAAAFGMGGCLAACALRGLLRVDGQRKGAACVPVYVEARVPVRVWHP